MLRKLQHAEEGSLPYRSNTDSEMHVVVAGGRWGQRALAGGAVLAALPVIHSVDGDMTMLLLLLLAGVIYKVDLDPGVLALLLQALPLVTLIHNVLGWLENFSSHPFKGLGQAPDEHVLGCWLCQRNWAPSEQSSSRKHRVILQKLECGQVCD